MDNIANMVDMLNNKNTDEKYEQMMKNLDNPNVKKLDPMYTFSFPKKQLQHLLPP